MKALMHKALWCLCFALVGCMAEEPNTFGLADAGDARGATASDCDPPQTVRLVAHNSYVETGSPASSAEQTLAAIASAVEQGADGIELDVVYADGKVRVQHVDDGADGAVLDEILSNAVWDTTEAELLIELKERTGEPPFAELLVAALAAHASSHPNRTVWLRSFGTRLEVMRAVDDELAAAAPELLRGLVRRSVLLTQGETVAAGSATIAGFYDEGFEMVELPYEAANLRAVSCAARAAGLGVGAWTIPSDGRVPALAVASLADLVVTDERADVLAGWLGSPPLLERNELLASGAAADIDVGSVGGDALVLAGVRMSVGESPVHLWSVDGVGTLWALQDKETLALSLEAGDGAVIAAAEVTARPSVTHELAVQREGSTVRLWFDNSVVSSAMDDSPRAGGESRIGDEGGATELELLYFRVDGTE